MPRIVYTVTCTLPNLTKAREWLDWMRDGHVQEVIKCGASSAEIVRYADLHYEVRYIFPDRISYDGYIRDHAPRLRAEGLKLFPPEDGFVYTRSATEFIE